MEVASGTTDESSEDEAHLNPENPHPASHSQSNPGFLGLESSSSTYHNPEDLVQFVISGLLAKGLKKGLFFAPDPYVKFKIGPGYSDQHSIFLPHHGQNCRTTVVENTTEPKWPEQVKHLNKLFQTMQII